MVARRSSSQAGIAGDWNTSRWLDEHGVPEPAGQEFLHRAAAAGWVELSLDADGREGKTWYGSTNLRLRPLDHVFADTGTAATLRSPARRSPAFCQAFLRPGGWFELDIEVSGSEEAIATRMSEVGIARWR